jgi:CSLREA domain-containing protein
MNLIHPLRRLPGVLLTAIGALGSANTYAATITVNTVDDAIPPDTDGLCSLREALANASDDAATFADCPAGTGDDEITFAESLFTSPPHVATIQLSGELSAGYGAGEPHALGIRPPVLGTLPGRVRLVASATTEHRVMSVRATASPFSMEGVSIEGGTRRMGHGGGVHLSSDDATFTEVQFIGNATSPTGAGGGLYQANGNGFLHLDKVQFSGNRAGRGGAIFLDEVGGHGVTVLDGYFDDNQAMLGRGGAIGFQVAATHPPEAEMPYLDISSSVFTNNQAATDGGAISVDAGTAGEAQRFVAYVSDSRLGNNEAGVGGAIRMRGAANNNLSSAILRRNSFLGNQATDGGGVATGQVFLAMENNLFSANLAQHRGGGWFHTVSPGAQPVPATVAGNTFHAQSLTGSLPEGGGRSMWLSVDVSSFLPLFLAGNLFAPHAELPPVGQECQFLGPVSATGGYNLSPVHNCGLLDGDDLFADPMVAVSASGHPIHPLAVLPQPGSPAIDAWPSLPCSPLGSDLLGQPRPMDGDGDGDAHCDIGAFELSAAGTDLIFADDFED